MNHISTGNNNEKILMMALSNCLILNQCMPLITSKDINCGYNFSYFDINAPAFNGALCVFYLSVCRRLCKYKQYRLTMGLKGIPCNSIRSITSKLIIGNSLYSRMSGSSCIWIYGYGTGFMALVIIKKALLPSFPYFV